MTVYKFFKILFMFVKHGINPFLSVKKNKDKMIEKFSENDKKWLIDNAKGMEKEYIAAIFDMEWYE